MQRKLLLLIPLVLFVALAFGLVHALAKDDLAARPLEAEKTVLPLLTGGAVKGVARFSNADLAGRYVLINVFASWCQPCLAEWPILKELSASVPVYGIVFFDKPDAVEKWLAEHGNPFKGVLIDEKGKLGVELGIKGVPETLLLSPNGSISYRKAGQLTMTDVKTIEKRIR
jgi:cytochrome c biogenesis protein CcmG/thiol:disulfide interchange protein DsbE